MDTDDKGIISQHPFLGGEAGKLTIPELAIAQAQHQADIEVVENVKNPYPHKRGDPTLSKTTWKAYMLHIVWEAAREAILKALKANT